MKINPVPIYCFVVIVLHVIGFIGLTNPVFSDLAKFLIPFHILLMAILIGVSQTGRNKDFWKFLTLVFLAGFVIDLLGVHTGFIFGDFSYGVTLGPKFAGVPVIIGLHWIIIIYSAGCLVKHFKIKNRIMRSVVGAFLIAIVDYLIEPIAIRHDYWTWTQYDVPAQNYVAWFLFSFLMLLVFYKMRFSKSNKLGPVLFICQFLFFLGLNFILV